ncbi:3-dehydroquinate synthase [Umboniibacter marinipuniceus]|uniref:3-dehydroquinate synthase n=1 Tax=Umboniibacter marinipuniceus TaxID=569599 RepID=A0A3M0ABI9_9GAMM|nr:3-dehydroquinate synthase [Umboniibacter marinipuniceus]RMA82250.1 3-dehydroquinate synthase [Umboniibacter marinipuniceus]
MKTLNVDLDERSYPIYIGSDLLSQRVLFDAHIRAKQVCIVTNETLADSYAKQVAATLSDYQLTTVVLPDGEAFKTLDTLQRIFDQLLEQRHNRTTTLIAIGGGVVGDMTGFAAACYQRGVDFIQVPTTLLSQVDSSVGGKTGVNHPAGKNMIGAFYQPQAVAIDLTVLTTLPARELSAGLAEVIKYGLIWDHEFFEWLEENMEALRQCNLTLMEYAIQQSCAIKAQVVAADEREGGLRAILNLGHTFGHAIETHQGYGAWLHGEAVGTGMVVAAELSAVRGYISSTFVARIRKLMAAAGLPIHIPSAMTNEEFLQLMAVDKKVLDGRLRLILNVDHGKSAIFDDITEESVKVALDRCRKEI